MCSSDYFCPLHRNEPLLLDFGNGKVNFTDNYQIHLIMKYLSKNVNQEHLIKKGVCFSTANMKWFSIQIESFFSKLRAEALREKRRILRRGQILHRISVLHRN